jgi:hypothetical protein
VEFLAWLATRKPKVEGAGKPRQSTDEAARKVPVDPWEALRTVSAQAPTVSTGSVPLPNSIAPDPERRAGKAAEAAREATPKTYRTAVVATRTSAGDVDPKAYLSHHNRNEEGNLVCQLCDGPMPFKLNGEDHFEAIQFVSALSAEVEANHLATCPNCAAEYRHACGTPQRERALRLLRLALDAPEESLRIALEMPVHKSLRFTQRHLVDLREALRVIAGPHLAEPDHTSS